MKFDTDCYWAKFDGFTVKGRGVTSDSADGIQITSNGQVRNVIFGDVKVNGFEGHGYYVDSNNSVYFNINHGKVQITGVDAGNTSDGSVCYFGNLGTSLSFDQLHTVPVSTVSGANSIGVTTDGGGVFNVKSQLSVSGSAGKALQRNYGRISIPQIHYEAREQVTVPEAVVYLVRNRLAEIGQVYVIGAETDWVYVLANNNGNYSLGPWAENADATVNQPGVNLKSEPLDTSWYYGDRSDCRNFAGSSNEGLIALGDMEVVDPLKTGTITLPTGGTATIGGVLGQEGERLFLQSLSPSTTGQVAADYAVDVQKRWDDSTGAYVADLSWATDPGSDMDFDYQFTTVGSGGAL